MSKQHEGPRKVKVEMVCPECSNEFQLDDHYQKTGAIVIDTGYIFICDQCGAEMQRRVTKISAQITETIVY